MSHLAALEGAKLAKELSADRRVKYAALAMGGVVIVAGAGGAYWIYRKAKGLGGIPGLDPALLPAFLSPVVQTAEVVGATVDIAREATEVLTELQTDAEGNPSVLKSVIAAIGGPAGLAFLTGLKAKEAVEADKARIAEEQKKQDAIYWEEEQLMELQQEVVNVQKAAEIERARLVALAKIEDIKAEQEAERILLEQKRAFAEEQARIKVEQEMIREQAIRDQKAIMLRYEEEARTRALATTSLYDYQQMLKQTFESLAGADWRTWKEKTGRDRVNDWLNNVLEWGDPEASATNREKVAAWYWFEHALDMSKGLTEQQTTEFSYYRDPH